MRDTSASGRRLSGVWAAALCVLVSGCGEKGAKVTEAAEASAEIAGEEDDLLSRRDALLLSREQLRERRAELAEQRRQIRAAGGDTSAVDEQADELLEQERRLVEEEATLNRKYEEILRQRRAMMDALASGGGEVAQVAARESGVAAREKDLARREDRLAQREDALAERERKLALRERETCGVAQPATIIQTVDAKGSSYTRRDVDPLLRRARSEMTRKGILPSDLPSPAQGLEREATQAMKEGDFGRARFAASQLAATVNAIQIDRPFIQAKIGRLSAAMKGLSIDPAKQKEVDELFKGATADYGDGKFPSANRRLNRIYALIF